MNLKKLALNGLVALTIYQADGVACQDKVVDVFDDLSLPIMSENIGVSENLYDLPRDWITVQDSTIITTGPPIAYRTYAETGLETTDPITLPFTAVASDKLLVLCIQTSTTTARTGGAPVRGTQTFTQVGTAIVGSGECTAEMWYLSSPTVGAVNIVIQNDNTVTFRGICSAYTGYWPIFLDQYTTTNTTVASPALTLNNIPPYAAVVDSYATGRTSVSSASDTLIVSHDEGSWGSHSQYAMMTSAGGSKTFTWTGTSDDVAFIMASFTEILPTQKVDKVAISDSKIVEVITPEAPSDLDVPIHTEAIKGSDSPTRAVQLVLSASDAVKVSDTKTTIPNLAISSKVDSVSLSESGIRGLDPVLVSVKDTISSISEAGTRGLNPLLVLVSDSIATSDAPTRAVQLVRSVQDSLSLSDQKIIGLTPLFVSVTDRVATSDVRTPRPTPRFVQAALSTSDPVTRSITTNSGDNLLVLHIVGANTTTRTGGSPTFVSTGTQYFSQIDSTAVGTGECTAELWYLRNPTIGGGTVYVPNSGALNLRVMLTVFNTASNVGLLKSISFGGSGSTISFTLANIPATSIVIDVFGTGKLGVPTGSDIVLVSNDEGVWCDAVQYQIQSETGNQTFTWTQSSGSDDVAWVMAAFSITEFEPVNSDLCEVSDVATVRVTPFELSVKDSVKVSDRSTVTRTSAIPVSDAIAVSDQSLVTVNLAISVLDAIAASDASTLDRLPWLPIQARDDIGISEVVDPRLSLLVPSGIDTTTLSDSASVAIVLQRSGIDRLSTSDRAIVLINPLETITQESVKVSDTRASLLNLIVVSKVDSVAVSDVPTAESILHPDISVSEGIAVSDVPTVERITPLEVAVRDDIEASDVITDVIAGIANDLNIPKTEWAKVSDSFVLEIDPLEIISQDNVFILDQSVLDLLVTVSDSVGVSDVPTAQLITPLEVSVSDAIKASDGNALKFLNLVPHVLDSIAVSDTPTLELITPLYPTGVDSLNIAEGLSGLQINPINLSHSDEAYCSDIESWGNTYTVLIDPILVISKPDSTTISDQAIVEMVLAVFKQESVTVSESRTLQPIDLDIFKTDSIKVSESTPKSTSDTYLGPITDTISLFDELEDILVQVHGDLDIFKSDYIGIKEDEGNAGIPERVDVSDVSTVQRISPWDGTAQDSLSVSDVSTVTKVDYPYFVVYISAQEDIGVRDYLIPPAPIPTDFVGVSDSNIVTTGIAGTLFVLKLGTEKATISDGKSLYINPLIISHSDTIKASDLATSEAGDLNLPHQDDLAISDSKESRLLPIVIHNQDDIAISEGGSLLLKPLVVTNREDIKASDLGTPLLSLIILSAHDNIAVSDISTISRGTPGVYEGSTIDNIATSDLFTVEINPLELSSVDSIKVSDTNATLSGMPGDYFINVSDSIKVSDQIIIGIDPLLGSGSDYVKVSDQPYLLNNPLIVIVSDRIASSDRSIIEIDPLELYSVDTISASDSNITTTVAAVELPLPIATDSIDISDQNLLGLNPVLVSVRDSVSISDTRSANLTLLVSNSDYIGISDPSVPSEVDLLISVSDYIKVSDSRIAEKAGTLEISSTTTSVLTFTPLQSSDDCWEVSATDINLTGMSCIFGTTPDVPMNSGFRFPNVTIPAGSSITSAKVTFQAYTTQSQANVYVRIKGEDADNPVTFSTYINYDARTRISGHDVDWTIPAWTIDTDYDSPDITAIVQHLISRAGWASGNSIVLFFADNGSDHEDASRQAKSYDLTTTYCARLTITWATSTRADKTGISDAPLVNLGHLPISVSDSIKVSDIRTPEQDTKFVSKVDSVAVSDTRTAFVNDLRIAAVDSVAVSDIRYVGVAGNTTNADYIGVRDFYYLRVIKQTLNWGEIDASSPTFTEVDANWIPWGEIDP